MIDLSTEQLETVKHILRQYVPACEVLAYGSRVTGTARSYSDLDLAVKGETQLDRTTLLHLKEAFENSELPFRVEVLDWHQIDESFREVINNTHVVLQHEPDSSRTG